MSKELKTKAVKFGVKLILKYLGADLLGDATGLVAGVGETVLPETTKNLLEAFSDTTADFFSDEGGDFAKSYLTKSERYVNFHLARGICKVWENALTDSLPKNQPQTPKPKFTGFHKSFPTVPKYFMGRIGVLEQLEKTLARLYPFLKSGNLLIFLYFLDFANKEVTFFKHRIRLRCLKNSNKMQFNKPFIGFTDLKNG